MHTLIVALNSKYIHTSLAPFYLKEHCKDACAKLTILEFTINDSIDFILASVYLQKADITAFSCYIWNIDMVLKIAKSLKKLLPSTKIVLGGPEVSFDSEYITQNFKFIDFIIKGEGEESFYSLLKNFSNNNSNSTNLDSYNVIDNLDSLASPYTHEMLENHEHKILYFEASRGCPFSCSYCISSTFDGIRFFSIDRVKKDLANILQYKIRQLKFVDRTFNCNKDRAKEIFKFIIEKGTSLSINFHFEVAADLFDDEMIDILSKAPEGLIQFEIGIQTTNQKTLEAVRRKTDLKKVFYNIRKLYLLKNIHLHLDLIAGLPFEDFSSFAKSFEDVYKLKPHQFQLGFLKLLKGSKMKEEANLHLYNYNSHPPYEFLFNKYLKFEEVLVLKGIEKLLDRYYNSCKFNKTLSYVIENFFVSSFDFYKSFFEFNHKSEYLKTNISSRELYTILFEFLKTVIASDSLSVISQILKFDFLSSDNTNNLPLFIKQDILSSFKEQCFNFLKKSENIEKHLPSYKEMTPKNIFKHIHFEIFDFDVTKENLSIQSSTRTIVLFDYMNKNSVTNLFKHMNISQDF